MRRPLAALAALALAGLCAGAAQAASPVSLVPVGTFRAPVGVVAAPGDRTRLFVVEQAGRIVVQRGRARTVFADLTDRVQADGMEQGLLGLAFAPDYATSGKVYVYYTARAAPGTAVSGGGGDLVVAEMRRTDADHANRASARVVLHIPHRGDQYENGGQLQFGPDGRLWIGTGDGGDDPRFGRNSQLLDPAADDPAAGYDALLGKLLRIDPAPGDGCGGGCTIPADNPGFAQREVWAYGLRNPWRFSFDALTGDLAIADVGDSRVEEVDTAPAPARGRGVNFGWPYFEGDGAGPAAADAPAGCCTGPAIVRRHGAPDGYNAIIGGVVVRDPGLPALAGRYLYGALNTGVIQAARITNGRVLDDRATGLVKPGITSFGQDGCGRVYLTAADGGVYRLSQGEGACDAVGLTLTAPELLRLSTGRIRGTLTCAVACRATVRATLKVGDAVVGRTATQDVRLPAGRRAALTLRANAATRAALRRGLARGRRVTATIVVVARAVDGGARRRATVSTRVVT